MKNKFLLLILFVFLTITWQAGAAPTITSSMTAYKFDGNWELSNLTDGDYSTLFMSNAAQKAGDYIQLDYGDLTTVCGISVYFQRNTSGELWDAPTGTAKIQVSENALTWTDVATFTSNDIGSADTHNAYSGNAGGAAARYVRLYLVSAEGDPWLRVTEIEVETDCVVAERTISVETANATMGIAYIGTEGVTTVTTTEIVTATAVANENYVFVNWTNKATGEEVSVNTDYRYSLADDIVLVANFKWDSTIPRTGWTAYADSYHSGTSTTDGPASWALDGDRGTWWHSQYNPTETEYPHWIMFDLGESQSFTSFNYVSRNGLTTDSGNGNITRYELYVSDSEADVKSYLASAKVAEGEFEYDGSTKVAVDHVVEVPEGTKGRYVLLKGLASANGEPFAACAEFYLYLDAYNVSVVSADATRGYVYIGDEGITSVSAGTDGTTTVTITAVASEGYEFAGWYNGDEFVSSEAVYTTGAITESVIYRAEFNFIPVAERTVTVVSSDETKGSVAIIDPVTSGSSVTSTGLVTVLATPADEDKEFVNWTDQNGREVSTKAEYSYDKEGDITLTANFKAYYTVTVDNSAQGGTITVSDAAGSINSGAKVLEGTSLTITVKTNQGMGLETLTLNGESILPSFEQAGSYTFQLAGPATVSATYGTAKYLLTYEYSGSGYVEVWSSDTYESEVFPVEPAGDKYNMYDRVPFGEYIYIFSIPQNSAELTSLVVNDEEYVDNEDFLKYGDIEYEVVGPVHITAQFTGEDLSGVEEASAGESVGVYAVGGGINVVAENATADIYNVNGMYVRSARIGGTEFISLPAGFYAVVVNGETYKVVVK